MNIILQLPLYDILLAIGLLFGFFTGIANGAIRKIFRLGVYLIVATVLYITLSKFLANFIQYNLLAVIDQPIIIPFEGRQFVFYSIHDLVMFLQNLGIDSYILANYTFNMCKAVGDLAIVSIAGLITLPFTWILNATCIKRALSKKDENGKRIKYKPKAGSRILGGLIGIIEWGLIAYINSQSYALMMSGFNDVIIPQLQNADSDLIKLLTSLNLESNITLIQQAVVILNNMVNPLTSYVMKYLYKTDVCIWMYQGAKLQLNEFNEEVVVKGSVKETFNRFYELVIRNVNDALSSTNAS